MRLILHVGHPKTASTWLQGMLYSNRATLRQRGIVFPTDFRDCGGTDTGEPIRRGRVSPGNATILCGYRDEGIGFYEDPQRWRSFWGHLETYGAEVLILSCEIMFYLPAERIARLADEIARRGFDPLVVTWVDRQDRLLLRNWTQGVRDNHFAAGPDMFLATRSEDYMKFQTVLERWVAGFGADRVISRTFASEHLVGGDIWKDFVFATGLPELSDPILPARSNESLPLSWIETVRRANRVGLPMVPRTVHSLQKVLRPRRGRSAIDARYYTARLRDMLIARYAEANQALLGGTILQDRDAVRDYWTGFPPASI